MPRSMQAHGPVSKPLRVDSSDASSAANLHLRITKRCGLVLSQTHMYETQKRQEWEKRLDVVETMVELSRFHAITHVTNASWCAEVNATVHSEICAVPDERLAEERTVLKALPSLRPEIGTGSVRRKVDRLSCIRYGSARYSVPTRLVGATVAVVVDHGALIVLEPATGVIVAEHELVGPGEASILDEHYDGPGRHRRADHARKPQRRNSSAPSAKKPNSSW